MYSGKSLDLKRMCRDEFEAHHIYKSLSRHPLVNEDVRNVFREASEDEWEHYKILSSIVGECKSNTSKLKTLMYLAISILFGTTVTLKVIELSERSALSSYNELAKLGGLHNQLLKLVEDEEKHELELINSLDERRVKYLSSISLGVSDALVELTGIYAGALGVLSSTFNAGLIGVLAGISAALSMTVASYTQAKQDVSKSPRMVAIFTGLSYLAVVVMLALPYLLIPSIMVAFSLMLVTALTLIAYMTFYTVILHEKKYLREFAENSLLLLGTSFLLYILGNVLSISFR